MVFNSVHFLLFFTFIVFIYYLIPQTLRWVLLLCASYYFYMAWNPIYIVLIIFCTLINYIISIKIEKETNKKKRKALLVFSLVTSLGVLFVFKYFNFFSSSIGVIYTYLTDNTYPINSLKLLLPMGISFYTFQTLSYTIDVYRGSKKAEKHLGYFALYVTYFPQLVAGPIERSDNLLPQFKRKVVFDYDRIKSGLLLMLWGFLKKVVIADRIAILVNKVYSDIYNQGEVAIAVATVFFAIQIYCDFSAYSDIARGASRVLGTELMKNFNAPYIATSISDFWERWHISLSSWFRDYLYIPLGGNRVSKSRYYFNLVTVFIVSGLWHGANWTFIVWGALHGFYQVIENSTKNIRTLIKNKLCLNDNSYGLLWIKRIFVFWLVCIAWVFFRSNNISEAIFATKSIMHLSLANLFEFFFNGEIYKLGINKVELNIVCIFIALMYLIDLLAQKKNILRIISREPIIIRWALYYGIIFSILIFGMYGGNFISDFIYFQF